jgi:hypothetical protein
MDIMLDLETLGVSPGCVVLSIGAVPFNADTGDVHSTGFYADLNITSQLDQGLRIDEKTLLWWLEQQDTPRLHQAKAVRQHPGVVLDNFRDWYKAMKGATIWGNGMDFDQPILAALFRAYGIETPWKYNAGRDVRTLFALVNAKLGDFGSVNPVAHDALSDALFQAREVVKCVQAMKRIFVHGKQKLAELAQIDAELERQRQADTGDNSAGQDSDFAAGSGRDYNVATTETPAGAADGQAAGHQSENRETFIRALGEERPPTPEERRSDAQLYGH